MILFISNIKTKNYSYFNFLEKQNNKLKFESELPIAHMLSNNV